MAAYHGPRVVPIGEYIPLHITQAATLAPVGLAVSTTSATSITAGNNVVVTPASMSNITPGMILNIANGTGSAEDITVISTTATTFTANFVYSHSGAYTIISRRGTDVGHMVINTAGSATLTLYNGHPSTLPDAGAAFAVIDVSSISPREYNCTCNKGLFYTLSASTPDLTLTYIDHPA